MKKKKESIAKEQIMIKAAIEANKDIELLQIMDDSDDTEEYSFKSLEERVKMVTAERDSLRQIITNVKSKISVY